MSFTFRLGEHLKTFQSPCVMGILNTTPDSFFSASRKSKMSDALKAAEQMLTEGAAILDIGGQSTRPGSEQLDASQEMERVLPIISAIRNEFPEAVISSDTFYGEVANAAVNEGADIINDVSAGNLDANMLPTVAALKVPYILMHMQGTPKTMQQNPTYDDVVSDTLHFLASKLMELRQLGVSDVAIDPGFGFGKTLEHNYALLRNLHKFQILDVPVLAGVSRKGMIWKPLGVNPEDALNGTTAAHMIALSQGANILRVHDVKPAVEAIKIHRLANP